MFWFRLSTGVGWGDKVLVTLTIVWEAEIHQVKTFFSMEVQLWGKLHNDCTSSTGIPEMNYFNKIKCLL